MSEEDYGTFSAAIDRVVERAGKSPLREDIASLVRQVIRTNQVLSDFPQDRSETSFIVDVVPYQWRLPVFFRKIEIVRIMNRFGPRGEPLLFKKSPPGNIGLISSVIANEKRTYYRGGDIIAFGGHRSEDTLGVSYFSYLPPMADFGNELTKRPWRYDLVGQTWVDQRGNYGTLTDGSADPRAESELQASTNWLLFDWFELVVKGAMSAILNATDDPRGPKIFAEYSALQSALKRGATE